MEEEPKAKIAVCEPRRIAASGLAIRVSDELGVKLGGKEVGYHIGMDPMGTKETRLTT